MADDPWHVVKNEISTTLAEVVRLHAAARELSGPAAHPFLEKLETCLTTADLDLKDLEETISIVEAQRERFPIADSELESRRAFVRSTAASILAARRELASLRGAAGASSSAASIAPAHEHGPESESEGLLSGAAKPGKPKSSAAKAQAAQAAAQARRQQASETANLKPVPKPAPAPAPEPGPEPSTPTWGWLRAPRCTQPEPRRPRLYVLWLISYHCCGSTYYGDTLLEPRCKAPAPLLGGGRGCERPRRVAVRAAAADGARDAGRRERH